MAGDFVADGQPFEMPEPAAEQDYEKTPPSFGSFLGAEFQSGPTLGLQRAQQRGTQEGSSWFDQWVNTAGMTEAGLPIEDPQTSPTLSTDEANKRYAPSGSTITDQPIPEGLARILGQQKTDEINRESLLSRYSQAHSAPVNFGAGTLGFMLDPLNAATSFTPGLGEETILAGAGRLGLDTKGILARTGARLAAGAAGGVAAQAPLSAIQLGLSADSGGDYGLRDVARDMMFSAAGGAILHAGFGALSDAYRAARGLPAVSVPEGAELPSEEVLPIINADAQTKAAAMGAAVSQMADGREIDVAPVFDMAAANQAGNELSAWYGQASRLAEAADTAIQASDLGTAGVADLSAKAQALNDQLERLRSEHQGFLADIQSAQSRLADVDTDTPQRIAAINDELQQTNIAAARRDELTAELAMLTQGAAVTPTQEALERLRTQAELQGLQSGQKRVSRQINTLETRAGTVQDKIDSTSRQTQAQLRLQADRIESRERIVNALTARSIRRYAGRLGVSLAPGEDAAFASRVISGGTGEIPKVLAELRGRAAPLAGDLVPHGEPSDSDTAALRENIIKPIDTWAPETKARDDDGHLVTVYHGTPFDFDQFDRSKLGTATGDANTQYGFFFAADKGVADRYGAAEQTPLEKALQTVTLGGYKRLKDAVKKLFGVARGRTLTANLDVRNPKTVDLPGGDYYSEMQIEEALRRAKEEGHDSVKFRSLDDTGMPRPQGDLWVVFEPNQIKIIDHGDPALNARSAEAGRSPLEAQLLAEANDRFGRSTQAIVADTAARQRDVYRDGYAPGIPQAEFNEMNEAIYGDGSRQAKEDAAAQASGAAGEKQDGEGKPPTGEAQPRGTTGNTGDEGAAAEAQVDPVIAEAQRRFEALGPLSEADRVEIETALQTLRDADLQEQAYQQAGECLTGAFL